MLLAVTFFPLGADDDDDDDDADDVGGDPQEKDIAALWIVIPRSRSAGR
jgi:hypothetical protein